MGTTQRQESARSGRTKVGGDKGGRFMVKDVKRYGKMILLRGLLQL